MPIVKTLSILTLSILAACDLASSDQLAGTDLMGSPSDVLSGEGRTAAVPGDAPVAYSFTDGALYRQNFETLAIGSNWYLSSDPDNQLNVSSYTSGGINGRILTVKYIKWPGHGTERIGNDFSLGTNASAATLSYDVKFHSAFEFVKGGKLPGLGGGEKPTGCTSDPDEMDGWTIRVMWLNAGTGGAIVPVLYVYDRDRPPGVCGDVYVLPDENPEFVFHTGSWYRVDLQVQMNSTMGGHNGWARLYVEGVLVAEATDLSLKATLGMGIDTFMFNTFHGGDDNSWAPQQEETYAYFDNFTVRPGHSVSGTHGTSCEITEEGIYSPSVGVCCAEGCGACGGSGCGSLPGGTSNCCTGTILSSGNPCTQSGVSAPCYYP